MSGEGIIYPVLNMNSIVSCANYQDLTNLLTYEVSISDLYFFSNFGEEG